MNLKVVFQNDPLFLLLVNELVHLLTNSVLFFLIADQFGTKHQILKPVQLAHPVHVGMQALNPFNFLASGEFATVHCLAPELCQTFVKGFHHSPLPLLPRTKSGTLKGKRIIFCVPALLFF
jgi:hypothetical protein